MPSPTTCTPLVAIADDDTGATDLGDMIAQEGVKTVIFIDLPTPQALAKYAGAAQAVIVTTRSRSVAPDVARRKVSAAIERVRPLRPRAWQIKICATFDSTQKGNIGPSAEVAMEALGADFVPIVVALPVNGRTTYMGYQFVGEQILSDSPLKNHPLNPMHQSNLVEWLGLQTRRKVGLANLHCVRQGSQRLKQRLQELAQDGFGMALIDAIEQSDLRIIAQAIEDSPLLVGSSGIGGELAKRLCTGVALGNESIVPDDGFPGGVLVVAGSCSQRTREQIRCAREHGLFTVKVDAGALLTDAVEAQRRIEHISADVITRLAGGSDVLIYSSDDDAHVAEVQQLGQSLGMSVQQVGLIINEALTSIVVAAVRTAHLQKLIVAGGETAGQICRGLSIEALEVGGRIDPGVPWCIAKGDTELAVVLKSGGFGSEDFFLKAANQLNTLGGCR